MCVFECRIHDMEAVLGTTTSRQSARRRDAVSELGTYLADMCVAVAKLSKALAWLSCARLRERPEFES